MADLSAYEKGSLLSFDEDWYHGKLTRVEAEKVLTLCGRARDCFLVRESLSTGDLVLSLMFRNDFFHIKIEYGPSWYKLYGTEPIFDGVQELVNSYQRSNPEVEVCKKAGNTTHKTGK